MRRVLLFLVLVVAFSCTNEEGARRTLEGAGYTDIELHGYAAWKCSKDDTTCTEFTATGPTGRRVHGAVGCGVGCGKGCTIRTD